MSPRLIAAASFLFAVAASNAQVQYKLDTVPQNVLFIGNSYTYTNLSLHVSVPAMAAAAADPDTFATGSSLIGGAPLARHWNDGDAPAKIRSGDYDVVILQEFVNMDPNLAYVDSFYHYAALFDALIDSVGAQTVFYQTWNTPYMNFTYLKAGYDSAAGLFNAPVIPAGEGYKLVNADRPGLNLYGPDNHHPGWPGTYLTTCVFYAALTGKSPVSINYTISDEITAEEYAYLQGAAWDVMREFIEAPCSDASAPAVPAGVTGEALSTSSVRITWDAVTHTCGHVKYNISRAGTFVGAAYETQFTDEHLLGGTEYAYTVTAVSAAGAESAPSSAGTVTTMLDTIPPELVEARYTRLPTRVVLYFNEPMDSASAETPGNYAISNGITVTGAELTGAAEVTLTTSTMVADVVYTVTVTGVKDNASVGNSIAAGTAKSFSYIPLSFMDDCVGYWPFDGTLDDFSPTGANGTWKKGENFVTGYLKDGIEATGDSSSPYVVIPRDDAQGGMDALTFAVWVKKAHADTGGYVIQKHTVYQIELNATQVKGYVYNNTGTRVTFDKTLTDIQNTEWHHVCVTYDGAEVTAYLDAVPFSTFSLTGPVSTASRDINVGKYPWGDKRTFKGKIDELRIYDAAMDSAGVAALYNDQPYAAGDADSAAVRILLDRNAVASTVDMVTTRNPATGRVLALHLDSLSVDQITDHIGTLTALRALYCTGAPAADTALISVDPAIGYCTALETLVLVHNTLAELPDEIAGLTNLAVLDVGDNLLCDVQEPVKTWLDTYDPDWQSTQAGCTGIMAPGPATAGTDGAFSVTQATGRVTVRYAGNEDAGVRILAVDGTTAFAGTFTDGTVTWIPRTAGVYVVELKNGISTEAIKIVIW